MLKLIHWVLAVIAMASISLSVTANERYPENGRIEIFGDGYENTRLVDPGQGRFVFFRVESAHDSGQGVVTVLVNEHYHTSLRPGTFSTLCAPQGAYALAAVRREVGGQKKARLPESMGIHARLEAGRTRYFRLLDTASGEKLLEMESADALSLLQQTREAIHTISRVKGAQTCKQEKVQAPAESSVKPTAPVAPIAPIKAEAPPPPVLPASAAEPLRSTVSQFSFAADTLFAFGKATRESMPIQGLRSLEDLKERLVKEYKGITEVRVIGYADPIGGELANMQLSQMRADEVKNYLRSIGLVDVLIKSEGRGATELVASHCPNANTPVAILCHQPNRRVVIEVTGVRVTTHKTR